jgi:hypothetical protein
MNRRCVFPPAPFTTKQAAQAGITRSQLTAGVENREIRRVLTGVYVRAELPDTSQLRARAALLVISPFSVICDRTAAWIHDVDVLDYHELDVLPPLETYVLRGHDPTDRPECAGGTRDLRSEDICLVDGVPVTTPLRTAMDLGCKMSRRRALAAMDAFMRHHGVTRADMELTLPRYFRRRGVVQLRQLVPIADPRAESSGESWVRLEIDDARLPPPVPQHWVCVGGRQVWRLDLAYPHAKVAIEYDGREFHEGEENEQADERRRGWLREQGWIVIVLDKHSFAPEARDAWIDELKTALQRRS